MRENSVTFLGQYPRQCWSGQLQERHNSKWPFSNESATVDLTSFSSSFLSVSSSSSALTVQVCSISWILERCQMQQRHRPELEQWHLVQLDAQYSRSVSIIASAASCFPVKRSDKPRHKKRAIGLLRSNASRSIMVWMIQLATSPSQVPTKTWPKAKAAIEATVIDESPMRHEGFGNVSTSTATVSQRLNQAKALDLMCSSSFSKCSRSKAHAGSLSLRIFCVTARFPAKHQI